MVDPREFRNQHRIDEPPPYASQLPLPDAELSGHVAPGNMLYERWRDEYRRWYVEDNHAVDDSTYFKHSATVLRGGDHRVIVDTDELGRRLTLEDSRWLRFDPSRVGGHGMGDNPDGSDPPDWIVPGSHTDVPEGWTRSYYPLERRWAPLNASDLTLSQMAGKGSRLRANRFLRGEDGLVDPSKGVVQGWKACFGAYGPTDNLLAVAVLGRPRARSLDNGDLLELYRLAAHPIAPSNTNSKLIGRVGGWARNMEYDRLLTYANLDEQEGTCYRAAGLELVSTSEADPDGWKARGDDRQSTEPDTWTRGRFERAL